MGCSSSNMRQTLPPLGKVEELLPISPSLPSVFSDAPAILESPTSSGFRELSTKHSTPLAVQPTRRLLHRRRRQEPHLDHHLTDRLDMLAQYLQRAPTSGYRETLHAQTHKAVNDLQDHINSFFVVYDAEKRPLWRLAQTGRLVQQVESFHRSLDAITARCGLAVLATSGTRPSLPRWQARWRRMRAERQVFFRSNLEDHGAAALSTYDQLELLTLLKHDARKFDTVLTADELELLTRTLTIVASCCSDTRNFDAQLLTMPLPEWFIAPYERNKQQIKWQRSAVIVQKAPQKMTSPECFDLASMWSRLHHQHVMKLYGACHVGQRRFFVVVKGTPLTQCFGDSGFPLWQAFYEAALALRYLHDRQIGFDSLSCADLILFRGGDRDTVMLAGFGLQPMKSESEIFNRRDKTEHKKEHAPLLEEDQSEAGYNEVDVVREEYDAQSNLQTLRHDLFEGSTKQYWQAPELVNGTVLAPTKASDVFALGMCVVEAFSGGNVWSGNSQSNENSDDQSSIDAVPPRPAALGDSWQWALVERMCSLDPQCRPSLTEVLTSFRIFAQDEETADTTLSLTKRRKALRRHSLRQTRARATLSSIACALREVRAWCDEAFESSALNFQLFERMDDLAARLETIGAEGAASQLSVLSALIFRFRDLLQRHVNENSLLRLAATRQAIEMNVELHRGLDILMDRLRLNRSGASIHSWKSQQALYCQQLWKRVRLTLTMDAQKMIGELDDGRDLLLLGALLAFEANQRSTSYAVEELKLLQNAFIKVEEMYQSTKHGSSSDKITLPQWFVPPYEVQLTDFNAFSRAGFGFVQSGKWMNLNVVVKKLVTCEESGVVTSYVETENRTNDIYKSFIDEISLWSSLEHPNVLKLVGACHVGPLRFSLCEYAAQGTIDSFVASKTVEERSAWAYRLLHDAALGLLYLHTQNIVHADLRCSNIFIDVNDVVKLTDFGLSSLKKSRRYNSVIDSNEFEDSGSRWTAPECFDGESPTFASNVYSFAMCAIAVVSGELPWGCEMTDATVLSKIRKGRIPPRPANCFSESEWAFIKRMCCHDPKKRISMGEVVRLLKQFQPVD